MIVEAQEEYVTLEVHVPVKGWMAEKVKIGEPEDFIIDENCIDRELCTVGSKLCFYGNLAADLKSQCARKRLALETHDAELALTIRKSGDKITEGLVKERVKADLTHQSLVMAEIQSERDYHKVENLFRSQQKRSDCLIALAYKQRTELKTY